MKKKNLIRWKIKHLVDYCSYNALSEFEKEEEATKLTDEIKEIFLEWVGENYKDFSDTPVYYPTGEEIKAWREGVNFTKQEIRDKVMG